MEFFSTETEGMAIHSTITIVMDDLSEAAVSTRVDQVTPKAITIAAEVPIIVLTLVVRPSEGASRRTLRTAESSEEDDSCHWEDY
jgi:hypothetical protein